MWIWQECEDIEPVDDGLEVVDDWGAAAHRFARFSPGTSVLYLMDVEEDAEQLTLSLRYRIIHAESGKIIIQCGDSTIEADMQPSGRKEWKWLQVSLPSDCADEIILSASSECDLDGFFIHDEPLELPDDVRKLDPIIGQVEAEVAVQDYMRELAVPDVTPRFEPDSEFPSDIARVAAGDTWPVLESLAGKPCPYIVKAYDTAKGTDYNADYSWHSLDKEKRWELPWSGALGVVNPNSDVSYVIGFGFDTDPISYTGFNFRPVVHLVDTLAYEVDMDPLLRCEVAFRCHDSNTLVTTVHIRNNGTEERRVIIGELLAKDRLENPPFQRYILPGQMFGAGVTTTAGGLAWTGLDPEGKAVGVCFYEWIRGRSRGRFLLSTMVSAQKGEKYYIDPAQEEQSEPPLGAVLGLKHPVVIPPGDTAVIALALNMRRFTLFETWNPEITPELYCYEPEEEAVETAYCNCAEAISADIEQAVRESIEPYKSFPIVSLPEKSWEADFYACLELPRASTFSPFGNLKTPFYNFCRVHAHEPFGWWSYGMHAHENLSTLFTNITDPDLSARFLLGHIRHQREDGQYPYGISHTINPRLTTEEATAPLIVWEAWQSYLWSGDVDFLKEAYESGKRSHDWWLATRDRCGEGLCHWLNTSGESVRDDDGLPTWQVTGGSQYQEALDLNCYLLVEEQTLASMAYTLGLADEYEHYVGLAEQRAKLMNACMWHEEDRCYYGIGEVVPSRANVKDISTFFPLWAGLVPEGRFNSLVELIDDPETFGLPYGPPTLAGNEPCFGPQKHWYGSNWVEMSLFPILGLRNYGFYKRASALAYQNCKMVFDELERYGHFREYFNSIEGNGTDLIDYIWTAMPAFFIIGVFFGIQPDTHGLKLTPELPEGWNQINIENLSIRGRRISVRVSRDNNAGYTTATLNGEALRVAVADNREVYISWDDLADGTEIDIIQPQSIAETCSSPLLSLDNWSDVPPHQYPDDVDLIHRVQTVMKRKDQCG